VIHYLGEGSVGAVMQVEHKSSGQVYALKAIDKQRIVEQDLGALLDAEVRAQMAMNHPNLLRCFGRFEDQISVYLLLEFASGGDLFRVLKALGKLAELDAAHVFAQVLDGVQHLHEQGFIHRNLKPENVLLEGDLHVKIADFGWCARGNDWTTFCGTPCTLAPEIISGKAYDKRVDVWAIGLMLFEMLTGCFPFDQGGGVLNTWENIARGGLDTSLLVELPPATHSLIQCMLSMQSSDRPELLVARSHHWVMDSLRVRNKRAGLLSSVVGQVGAGISVGPKQYCMTRIVGDAGWTIAYADSVACQPGVGTSHAFSGGFSFNGGDSPEVHPGGGNRLSATCAESLELTSSNNAVQTPQTSMDILRQVGGPMAQLVEEDSLAVPRTMVSLGPGEACDVYSADALETQRRLQHDGGMLAVPPTSAKGLLGALLASSPKLALPSGEPSPNRGRLMCLHRTSSDEWSRSFGGESKILTTLEVFDSELGPLEQAISSNCVPSGAPGAGSSTFDASPQAVQLQHLLHQSTTSQDAARPPRQSVGVTDCPVVDRGPQFATYHAEAQHSGSQHEQAGVARSPTSSSEAPMTIRIVPKAKTKVFAHRGGSANHTNPFRIDRAVSVANTKGKSNPDCGAVVASSEDGGCDVVVVHGGGIAGWFASALSCVGVNLGANSTDDSLKRQVLLPKRNCLLGRLLVLGFTQRQAEEAAKRTSSVEAAVEWLVTQRSFA